jgi:type II secretory ATPase GspE/PulE/Tfp pilus assembly ATPase PilB-like protein
LIDIGVETYLITSAVEVFIAQRLVRLICKNCKEKYVLPQEIYRQFNDLGIEVDSAGLKQEIYRGRGCKMCNNTGYMGRTGIYEILLVSEQIKKMILEKAPSDTIKQKAMDLGMSTLKHDGWQKVLAGLTTPEEVLRVTQ